MVVCYCWTSLHPLDSIDFSDLKCISEYHLSKKILCIVKNNIRQFSVNFSSFYMSFVSYGIFKNILRNEERWLEFGNIYFAMNELKIGS